MKYKVSKDDLYLYQKVTQYFLENPMSIDGRGIQSPYENVSIEVRQDVVRGYARRNYQRDTLERNRGRVVVLRYIDNEFLIGKYSTVKGVMSMYVTSAMKEEHVNIIKKLIAHLAHHEIKLEVSTLEKKRLMEEKKWRMGDRVQRQGGRDGATEYNDWD